MTVFFADCSDEIRPGDLCVCHAPRSTPSLYRTEEDIWEYYIPGRILDYQPRCLPDGIVVMYLGEERIANRLWSKILYQDKTFYVATEFRDLHGFR